MRTYVITTGLIFALLTFVHLWRVAVEGTGVLQPVYVLVTLAAAGMSVWAWRVFRRLERPVSG
jgi:hypothetical protein